MFGLFASLAPEEQLIIPTIAVKMAINGTNLVFIYLDIFVDCKHRKT
jgi:hypothetical protein